VQHRKSVHIKILPNTWLGRLLAVAVAAVLVILAFFFITFVLVMVGVVILGALIRLLLPRHKVRGQTSDGAIEGEYSVVPEKQKSIDSAAQITPRQ
jgi:hypothetical protein